MFYPPGFYYVKKPKRFVILSSDKSSERNLFCCFDIIKPRRIEHLQKEEPFSSDPYLSIHMIRLQAPFIIYTDCLFREIITNLSKFVLVFFSFLETFFRQTP